MRLIDADVITDHEIIDYLGISNASYLPDVRDLLDVQPTIEAVPVVHGEWEECDWLAYDWNGECVRYPKKAMKCSNCSNAFKKELLWKHNFCPNCGAKMKGGTE